MAICGPIPKKVGCPDCEKEGSSCGKHAAEYYEKLRSLVGDPGYITYEDFHNKLMEDREPHN